MGGGILKKKRTFYGNFWIFFKKKVELISRKYSLEIKSLYYVVTGTLW